LKLPPLVQGTTPKLEFAGKSDDLLGYFTENKIKGPSDPNPKVLLLNTKIDSLPHSSMFRENADNSASFTCGSKIHYQELFYYTIIDKTAFLLWPSNLDKRHEKIFFSLHNLSLGK
jgi:hypothetical protein